MKGFITTLIGIACFLTLNSAFAKPDEVDGLNVPEGRIP